jgi:hypothetical protein
VIQHVESQEKDEPIIRHLNTMKVLRIFLLLFIGLVVLIQVRIPGLHDTQRRFLAVRHLKEAHQKFESAPGTETQRELEAATLELEEARRLDRRDLIVIELFLLGLLGTSAYAFIRAGKHIDKIPVAP